MVQELNKPATPANAEGNIALGLDAFSLEVGARTMWMEARGQGLAGLEAVGFVLYNRLCRTKSATLAWICLEPLQFSSWNTSDPNRGMMARCRWDDPNLIVSRGLLSDIFLFKRKDTTGGATLYCNLDVVIPSWDFSKLQQTVKIRDHTFYREL